MGYAGGYGMACDWWSLGVMMYAMLVGKMPFEGSSPKEVFQKIVGWKQHLSFPSDMELSVEARDLITKLITSADQRLGR